jgi:hypothetical protein
MTIKKPAAETRSGFLLPAILVLQKRPDFSARPANAQFTGCELQGERQRLLSQERDPFH